MTAAALFFDKLNRPSKSRLASAFGKDDRYERNPSGVSFVFNHRIFRTFIEVLKMPFSLSKILFDRLKIPPAGAGGILLCFRQSSISSSRRRRLVRASPVRCSLE